MFNVTADNVIRLLPPLILSDDEADLLVRELSGVVHAFLGATTEARGLPAGSHA